MDYRSILLIICADASAGGSGTSSILRASFNAK